MNDDILFDFASRALFTLVLVSAPIMVPVLIAGIILGMLQAATSINESVITFVPKIVVVILCLLFFAPMMMSAIATYATDIFAFIPLITR